MSNNGMARLLVAVALLMSVLSQAIGAPRERKQGTIGNERLFSLPVGSEGILYEGGQSVDSLPWGPAALAVAPDGTFWIADTVGNRLRAYGARGEPKAILDLAPLGIVGIGDLEAGSAGLWVLDIAAPVPALLHLTPEGKLLQRKALPKGLRLEDGLSGIALGDSGEVWIECWGGARLVQLLDSRGQLDVRELPGYVRHGRIYSAQPADLGRGEGSHGRVTVDGQATEVTVLHTLAGLRFLGARNTGDFFLLVEEMVSTPTIRIEQTVRHYSAEGVLLGTALLPGEEPYTYVAQGIVMGPDGSVYALLTRRDGLEVWRLAFFEGQVPSRLKDLPPDGESGKETSAIAPAGCRSRSEILSTATGYVNNQKYLSATNTDGPCNGRGKPRYIAGPGTYASVPYDWGGFDTVNSYNSAMHPNSYQAGDIDSCNPMCWDPRQQRWVCCGVEGCSRGVDCSGFVSRCWGLATKHSTWTLPSVSCALRSTSCLVAGDILNRPGVHVVLFSAFASNGIQAYEATTANRFDRVVYRYLPWGSLAGYVPRRYCSVCTTTCLDTCAASPSPCP